MTVITWDGPAARLRGATPASVAAATAGYSSADWARLKNEHLDVIGLRLFGALEDLGIDMDGDPIAVFCRLYLDARSARLGYHWPPEDWAADDNAAIAAIRYHQPPGRFDPLYAHEAATSMITAAVRGDMTADDKLDAIARVCNALEEVELDEMDEEGQL